MKKLLLIPALIAGTMAVAKDYKYEISPMIGYNIAEGNLGFDGNGYLTGGVELQFNSDAFFAPEISLFYTPTTDYDLSGDTQIARGAFNAVHTFKGYRSVVPFAKIGGGLEKLSTESYGNKDGFFFDAGAGAKIPFTDNLALKLEAIYMAKINKLHAGSADNNLMTLVGLTYSFGAKAPKVIKEEVVEEVVVVAPAAPVDSDNDGVIDTKDSCANTPAGVVVDAQGCPVPLDDDHDGVANDMDKCPATAEGVEVDVNGCDVDMDKDGVLNVNDICPDTPLNTAVNSDGCPATTNLHINFQYNSFKVTADSIPHIDQYADFLKSHTNYSTIIVGYTDSIGSAAYNKRLSQKRADAVKQLLIERGVNPAQITAEGRGEENPIASNDTEEGRAQNRRIEAELVRH